MASAASEKTIRAQRAKLAKDRENDKTIIKTLMSHPDGRRWIWNKLNAALVFHEGESLEPTVMAYQKGVRNGGLQLLASCNRYAPDMYIQMLRENSPVELQPEADPDALEAEEEE
jgi:hypothetical protein